MIGMVMETGYVVAFLQQGEELVLSDGSTDVGNVEK